jgi:hypothetical protein
VEYSPQAGGKIQENLLLPKKRARNEEAVFFGKIPS